MTGRILYSYGDTKQLFGILHFVGVLHLISGFSSIFSSSVSCFLCYVTPSIKHIEARI